MVGKSQFQIKISDMLKSKVTDSVEFENVYVQSVEWLTEAGVSGKIVLQSLGRDAIFAQIEELVAVLDQVCDRCGKSFTRDVHIEDYSAKYVAEVSDLDDPEDELLLIDMKNGVIDLEEMIVHAIGLQKPFVNLCPECEALQSVEIQEDEAYEDY